jgi:hypothetical protein
MKKLLLLLSLFFSSSLFSQSNLDSKGLLIGLEKEEWLKVEKILSYESADSIYKISPIDLLRYLISEKQNTESNIKLIKYSITKSWITKKHVTELMKFIHAGKKSRQIQSNMSNLATQRFSTLGLEAMHLINLYKIQNYKYPGLNVGFLEKPQKEMAKDFDEWWSKQ